LVQFALIWYLTKETESAAVLTGATLAAMLPMIVLGPFVGALVDRWNRRKVMLAADSLVAAATLALAGLFAAGIVELWMIFVIIFLRSIGGGFHRPAMEASTSLMVPEDQLTRVQGANQTLRGGLNILSAPLGALLLEILPIQGILAIDVVSALFAVFPLLFILIPQPKPAPDSLPANLVQSVWKDFQVGLDYVMSWKGLIILIGMAVAINVIITPAFALLPLLVREHFQAGAVELGWIESAFGVGSILGGLLLGAWGGFNKRIYTVLMGLFFEGAGLLIVGVSPSDSLLTAAVGIFIVAVSLAVVNGPIMAMLQAAVDAELQGRVFSLVGSLTGLASPFGLLLAGPLAEITAVQTWFLLGGIISALISIAGFFIPALLDIETGRTAASRSAPDPVPEV
jgi:DHA3 family macrolide efflux protein-like MFS transporter